LANSELREEVCIGRSLIGCLRTAALLK